MATTAKGRQKSVARGAAKRATPARGTKAKRRPTSRIAASTARTKKPATTSKARKKGTPVKAVAAKRAAKKVARKRTGASAAAGATRRSPPARIVRATTKIKQIPRAERSYARKPTPAATEPFVELTVPELMVPAPAQGEVPAGGE